MEKNVQDEFDLGTGAAEAAPETLAILEATLDELIGLEIAAASMEADLSAAKRQINVLKTIRVPDLMTEMQMSELTFKDWKVKIADFVSGSLPKEPERREKALGWLEENGAGGLIKTTLSVEFGRGHSDDAIDVARSLEADGFAPKVDRGVHAQSLMAFARERLKDGSALDLDLLGIYTGKIARIKQTVS